MKKCKFEDFIDDYLLNRLDEDKKKKFEEHYFNCPYCFEKMVGRDELISIIKDKGDMIFQDEGVKEEARGVTWFEKIVSLLTPKQWAAAAVSACLLLLISGALIFYVIYNPRITPPSFRMDKDNYDVRGPQIKLKLIPPFDIKAVPSKIEWSKAGENVKYEIFIYHNGVQLWSAETKENFKVLPEEVKRRMTSGEKYSCKVMALSSQEIPVASGEIEFKIQRTK